MKPDVISKDLHKIILRLPIETRKSQKQINGLDIWPCLLRIFSLLVAVAVSNADYLILFKFMSFVLSAVTDLENESSSFLHGFIINMIIVLLEIFYHTLI